MRSLLLFFLLLLVMPLAAQSKKRPPRPRSPFNAGLIVGFNSSQLDGDYQSGYNKQGLSGGLQSTVFLHHSLDLTIDLLFSQRGSRGDSGRRPRVVDIDLNYAETNFLLNFLTSRYEDGLPKLHLQAGISYARLLNHRVHSFRLPGSNLAGITSEQSSLREIAEHFKSDDLGVVAGAALHLGTHFTLSLRQNFSLALVFDEEDIPQKKNRSMRSFFLAIHGTYLFLDPYAKKRK